MAIVAELGTEMTLADLLGRLGPLPFDRICPAPAPGTATEDDLLAILDREDFLYELDDGILIRKTTGWWDSELTVGIIVHIGSYVREHRLGIMTGPDGPMRVAPGLVQLPDIAFVSRKRLGHRRPPREPIASYGPELAIEVLSPSNAQKEMADKLGEYFAAGTRLVWYVAPEAETVTLHESAERATILRSDDMPTGGDVLPGFEVPVAQLLTLPEPPAAPGRGRADRRLA